MGEAGQDKGPVVLCPAERVGHGQRTPDLQAQRGEAEQGEGPVNLRPAERPSHGWLEPVPKRRRTAKRGDEAWQGFFQHLPNI